MAPAVLPIIININTVKEAEKMWVLFGKYFWPCMPTGLLETPQGSRTTYWELLHFGTTILSVLWDHITVREDISRADVVILSRHTPTKVMCRQQSPVFLRLYLWNVPHVLLWRTHTWWPTKGRFCLLSYLLSTECHPALLAVVYRQSSMENNQMAHVWKLSVWWTGNHYDL